MGQAALIAGETNPGSLVPHPNLGHDVSRDICQSEIESGVSLDSLPVGAALLVRTKHHDYTIENRGDHKVLVTGHPEYCPEPTLMELRGSTWSMPFLEPHFIGHGMHLELNHPAHGIILTSCIQEIRRLR